MEAKVIAVLLVPGLFRHPQDVETHKVATAIIGIPTLEELAENLRIAREFRPLSGQQCREIENRITGRSERLWALRAWPLSS